MAKGLLGNVVREVATPRETPLDDDQAASESRGDGPPGKRPRASRAPSGERGRGRNIKMPDSLFDELAIYARRAKVRVIATRHGKRQEWLRSLTVSEAACQAIRRFLADRQRKPDTPPAATEE